MVQLAATTSNLYGVNCSFEHRGNIEMSDEAMTTHLYRVAQEAIRNSVHHGHARTIVISLERFNGGCELRIRDDGRGFAPEALEKGGMGMRIMEYRARMLGGHVTIGPHLDGGALVVCSFPLNEKPETRQH